mgnify:CR=1 FL=1
MDRAESQGFGLTRGTQVYEIAPRVHLGSIIEFQGKRSRQNLKIGYYDAKRMVYGLKGLIYYIDSDRDEEEYTTMLSNISEKTRKEIRAKLRLSPHSDERNAVSGNAGGERQIFPHT